MIRALTILFALALLWAAMVAVLFVGYADLPDPSLRCVPGTLDRLAARLPGQVSTPGDDGYAAATAIRGLPEGNPQLNGSPSNMGGVAYRPMSPHGH